MRKIIVYIIKHKINAVKIKIDLENFNYIIIIINMLYLLLLYRIYGIFIIILYTKH